MPDEKKPDEKPENNETPEIDETALYDAVSGAIDEVTITPEKKDDDDDEGTENDDESGADVAGKTDEDDADAAGSGDAGTATEGDKESAEEGKTADEKDAGDDSAAADSESGDDPKKKDDEAGGKPKVGDDPADKADPVNDPIPESTNEKTAERIKSLIGLVKDKSGSEDQRNEIVEQIQATGTDPEQYANTLGFLKLYNSKDSAQRKQALDVARGIVKELALELGEGASVTKLSDHDDLQAEVEAGTLTETRATEIASTRERQKLQDSRDAAAATKDDDTETTNANIVAGKNQLDALETELRTNDKDYADLREQFIGLLKPFLRRTHPTEWGEAAREVYDQVKLMPRTAVSKPKPKPKNTPLRPKQSAGGGSDKKTEAEDAVGAVTDALANM